MFFERENMMARAVASVFRQRFCLLIAVATIALGGCTHRYDASLGPEVRKPMFRGDPTLAALHPEARLPDADRAPPPNFARLWTLVEDEKTGTVYGHRVLQVVATAGGYAQSVDEGVQDVECNPRTTIKEVSLGGIIGGLVSKVTYSPTCPGVGAAYSRVETFEISDVSGHLFPLAVGNKLTYSARELLHFVSGGSELSNPLNKILLSSDNSPDNGLSDREHSSVSRYEVVDRLSSYRLKNGKEVGEVFVIREIASDGTVIDEWYFSTAIGWTVLRKQKNGLVVKLVNWE